VQHTIDRIIFLRIAEDRNVEQYGDLRNAIKNGDYYKNLLQYFYVAEQKYDSGLFDFRKDKISNRISIDDKVVKNVISELYYPECPYEFSVLSVEILGSAYEQFLGKQILLSKNGRAVIEEKPEIRKAGGVYYTPQYIVDYIVKNTVGKLIENKTPEKISGVKIVDPACGSGSFLIGAYQFLLNWHKDFYARRGGHGRGRKDEPLTPAGELTTAEKKTHLAEQHLRSGFGQQRCGSDQTLAFAQVYGGRNHEHHRSANKNLPRPRPADSGQQHKKRKQPDRPRFLRQSIGFRQRAKDKAVLMAKEFPRSIQARRL